MRIVAIIFGILAAIVDLILVIVSIAVPEVSLWGWIVVLTIVTVGLFFSANKVKKQKKARQAAQVARNTPFMEETAIMQTRLVLATTCITATVKSRPKSTAAWAPVLKSRQRINRPLAK